MACTLFAIYVYILLNPDQLPEEAVKDPKSYSRFLLVLVSVLDECLICLLIVILTSSEIDHMSEVIASYNEGFKLNEILRKRLIPGR